MCIILIAKLVHFYWFFSISIFASRSLSDFFFMRISVVSYFFFILLKMLIFEFDFIELVLLISFDLKSTDRFLFSFILRSPVLRLLLGSSSSDILYVLSGGTSSFFLSSSSLSFKGTSGFWSMLIDFGCCCWCSSYSLKTGDCFCGLGRKSGSELFGSTSNSIFYSFGLKSTAVP